MTKAELEERVEDLRTRNYNLSVEKKELQDRVEKLDDKARTAVENENMAAKVVERLAGENTILKRLVFQEEPEVCECGLSPGRSYIEGKWICTKCDKHIDWVH